MSGELPFNARVLSHHGAGVYTGKLGQIRTSGAIDIGGRRNYLTARRRAGCYVVYTIHMDPAGALPDWLFVRLTESCVVRVTNVVRKRIEVRRR